jgi:predicted nucleotidyltransferase
MQNREADRILSVVAPHIGRLRSDFHVESLALFGSIAKMEFTSTSDVDILVEFSEPVGFLKFIELETLLSKMLGRKVDLVTKNALKPAIRAEVQQSLIYV